MRKIPMLLAFILSLCLLHVPPASAAPLADVKNDQPVIDFPNTITFRATLSANANITAAVLEYGTAQQTCGDVIAKAFPEFSPGKTINLEWTWDMRQSTSLPPGAAIWWQWRYTDETGKETLTDRKTITWLDDTHPWQTLTGGKLRLHYYDISKSEAQGMLNAGLEGLKRNQANAGLTTTDPIDVYVYPNYEEMRDAVLFEPSWSGGQAMSEHNIVIMGVAESSSEWNQDTVVHELTHVLVGHFTFSCLSYLPQWLEEGLAVYSEGPLDDQFKIPLEEAIKNDTLLSIRVISGAFSEVRDTVDLSYAQSYSIVNYLIQAYGQPKMTELLAAFRDGASTDDALLQTYGFNIEGLEAEWRKAVGAQPLAVSAQPTAQPTPTFVPTIVPISGAPLVLQITATPIPTSSFDSQQPTQSPSASPGRPPLWLTLALLGFCCLFLLIIGVIALGLFVRAQNRKGGNNA